MESKAPPAQDRQYWLIRVDLPLGRFHGAGFAGGATWPPSPARLFSALFAGAGSQPALPPSAELALQFLETLGPPRIAAPIARSGALPRNPVPHIGGDALPGDPPSVAEPCVAKDQEPLLFDGETPLLYAFLLPPGGNVPEVDLSELALGLRQLIGEQHPAHARAMRVDAPTLERLMGGPGLRQSWPQDWIVAPFPFFDGAAAGEDLAQSVGIRLLCPRPGSLLRLQTRTHTRFGAEGEPVVEAEQGKPTPFRAPRGVFQEVSYGQARVGRLFDLVAAETHAPRPVWPLCEVGPRTLLVRDAWVARLVHAFPEAEGEVERRIIGRSHPEGPAYPAEQRPRLSLLPSVGHSEADHHLRRLLVSIPHVAVGRDPSGPNLTIDELCWALDGLEVAPGVLLQRAVDAAPLRHWSPRRGGRVWRTETPVALRLRRPLPEGQDGGREVLDALRHSGLAGAGARLQSFRLQAEPFGKHGARAESFALGTRFDGAQLHHLELCFSPDPAMPVGVMSGGEMTRRAQGGPLCLGDGRMLGLGLLRPVDLAPPALGVRLHRVETGWGEPIRPENLVPILRAALIRRWQDTHGDPPDWAHGHAHDGGPLRDRPHLHFGLEPAILGNDGGGETYRAWILAPHLAERRDMGPREAQYLEQLWACMGEEWELRAGASGRFVAQPLAEPEGPLFGGGHQFESLTPYRVRRHVEVGDVLAAITADVHHNCRSLRLPLPKVDLIEHRAGPQGRLGGRLFLHFPRPISGPLILGAGRHQGWGWFRCLPG
jgi:CRISPR-associated protein Csb2